MRDPYHSANECVARLVREYAAHRRLILAVDFDDTVFDFHGQGHVYDEAINLVVDAQKAGFYIVLFTGAPPERWPEQREYLSELGIVVDSINTNPIELPFGRHGKIFYNHLLDDRAGLGQACIILRRTLDILRSIVREEARQES